ncbi:MAG: hypothetical protein ACOC1G_01765 [Phycisphaeraceae bacterium]
MAVYLFTFHAYRSWRPDHRAGYTRKGKGVLPPDAEQARRYDQRAKHAPVRFDEVEQIAILDAVQTVCDRHTWRLHYACITYNHMHLLVSWTSFTPWNDVRVRLKRKMGASVSQATGRPGPWFSRGGRDSRKRVEKRSHFDHLVERYLPKSHHRGLHYCEYRGRWRQ